MAILTVDLEIEECEPLGYHVIVELHQLYAPDEAGETKSDGGIIITGQTVQKEQRAVHYGTVLEIGPWAHKNHASGCDSAEDWGYKVGDQIMFNAYEGKAISNDPKDLRRLLCDHDIKCKVKIKEA